MARAVAVDALREDEGDAARAELVEERARLRLAVLGRALDDAPHARARVVGAQEVLHAVALQRGARLQVGVADPPRPPAHLDRLPRHGWAAAGA